MSSNNRIELTGFLGLDAKLVEKEDKKFVALRVATTDSYKDGVHQKVWGSQTDVSRQLF